MRYHLLLTSVRMAIITKSSNNKCWRGCGGTRNLLRCWWERKLIQPRWRTVWRFLKKVKIELLYDPAIPLLDVYPENTIIQKDTCSLQIIYNSQDMEATQMPINRWMDKDVIRIFNGLLLSLRLNEIGHLE